MASLVWIINVLFVGVLSLPAFSETVITSHYNSISQNLTIFELGKYKAMDIEVDEREYSAPAPLLIVTPTDAGLFPVLIFIHGYSIYNEDYTQLFGHIVSHGYIVVAPQLPSPIYLNQQGEIDMATSVANWIPSNLQNILQKRSYNGIQADFAKLAISGHSRGGKTAFALALGMTQYTKLNVKISALIGVDPVAGITKFIRTSPRVLTYVRHSFKLSIPITVIGTGLGGFCAPYEVNHQEFFYGAKEKASHFVIKKYGHLQMLNDDFGRYWICAPHTPPVDNMRRTLGEIMIAFLDAYLRGTSDEYDTLIAKPFLAPTLLNVDKKPKLGYAQP